MESLEGLDNVGRSHRMCGPSAVINLFPQLSDGAVSAPIKGTVCSRVLFWVWRPSSDPGPGNKGSLYPCQVF